MRRFQKILVWVVSDSPRQTAVGCAARLAEQNGAAVKLITVVEDLPWYTHRLLPTAKELQALLVKDRSESLEKLASSLRQARIEVSAKVLTGRPYLETIREVLRDGHDLVLKEAEPNTRVRFGSVDMHLLRNCPCPVWLVRPDHGDQPIRRILAPVDPAPAPDQADVLRLTTDRSPQEEALDDRILELATSLAESEGGELHILHAWSAPGEGLLRGEVLLSQEQVDDYVEGMRTEARNALDRLIAKYPAGPGRRFVHLIKGDAAGVIVEFARTNHVDLIVMGTVVRTGIPGFPIGNAAETVLQQVDCSILAVKPDGFVSPISLDD